MCFLVWIRPEERDFQREGRREISDTEGEWRASSSEQEGGKMRKLGEDEESHGILKNLGWGRLKEDSMALIPHEDAFAECNRENGSVEKTMNLAIFIHLNTPIYRHTFFGKCIQDPLITQSG